MQTILAGYLPLRLAYIAKLLPILLFLSFPAVTQALDFTYMTTNGSVIITGYIGPGGAGVITNLINGMPVTGIKGYAFEGCTTLTSLTIPTSVTNIEDGAFSFCPNLTSITVKPGNPVYGSLDGVLFDRSLTVLGRCPEGKPGNYAIPSGVTMVWGDAFWSCASLTNISIPASVANIGYEAFANCSLLNAITVNPGNTQYSSSGDGVLFNKNKTTLIKCPGGKVGTYTIPMGVTNIDDNGATGFVGGLFIEQKPD